MQEVSGDSPLFGGGIVAGCRAWPAAKERRGKGLTPFPNLFTSRGYFFLLIFEGFFFDTHSPKKEFGGTLGL